MAYNENVVYENFILENKFKDILETKLDSIKFMTVDTDLQGVEGMKKTINTYTYEGAVVIKSVILLSWNFANNLASHICGIKLVTAILFHHNSFYKLSFLI